MEHVIICKRHNLFVRTYPALLAFIGFGKRQKSGINSQTLEIILSEAAITYVALSVLP